MDLPKKLLESLRGINSFNEEAFKHAHASGEQITSIRLNPDKRTIPNTQRQTPNAQHQTQLPVPWSTHGYYLPERPSFTLDPFFHAGCYYVQEASGMFLEEAIRQCIDLSQPLKVLDLCAAPGGKSTLLLSVISKQSFLLSNEVIRSRVPILEENITKWGCSNVIVTNNDPKDLARLQSFFDLIVIDAPCSGSGLFRRDPEAISEWSEQNVQLCNLRQQRIIADIYPALKLDGTLIYCTCSYSKEENEDILDWMMDEFFISNYPLKIDNDWNIVETVSDKHQAHGYRFWPDKLKGEGFFIACFRKSGEENSSYRASGKLKLEKLNRKDESLVISWLKNDAGIQLFRQNETILAFPSVLEQELLTLMSANEYIRLAGLRIGKIAGEELIPHHALALSILVSGEIVAVSLKREEALQYLRKEEVLINTSHKGWILVKYQGVNLGWIKVLLSRINNYYPKEWRILKK